MPPRAAAVVVQRGTEASDGPGLEFRFRAGHSARSRDAAAEFAGRLDAAIRAGQGLRAGFRLLWGSGIRGSIRLIPPSSAGVEWVERILGACYEAGQWVRVRGDGSPASSALVRHGAVRPAGSLPPRAPDGSPSWVESAYLGLANLPSGGRVEWSLTPFSPRAASGGQPPPIETRYVPPGFRLAPLTDLERVRREQEERGRSAGWLVSLRVLCERPELSGLLARLCDLVRTTSQAPDGAAVRWVRPAPWFRTTPPVFVATTEEVCALLPDRWSRAGGSGGADPNPLALPIGRTSTGTMEHLAFPDGEGRHAGLIGETGMGKSSTLTALTLLASRRAGVVLLDPIGDTARAFLDRLPASARERTLWISPTDSPLPMNALDAVRAEGGSPFSREKARFDLVAALRRVRAFRYAETPFWGPRLEEMLGRAILAAAALPRGTLVEAEELLSGRQVPVAAGQPPATAALVRELREAAIQRPEEMDGARRLLAEVTGSPVLRRLLCEPAAQLRPADLLPPAGITVVSGDAPATGEASARYLLAVYLALLWAHLLARPGGPKTVLALDEAQWYAHESTAEILRLGRRSNVHLYLATQSLAALLPPVREALLANAADFVLFRGSPDDAREFSRWRPDLSAGDLLSLDRGEAALLLGKGSRLSRVRTAGLPPAPPLGQAREEVRARGRRWEVRPPEPPEPDRVGPIAADERAGRSLWELLRAAIEGSPGAETVEIPLGAVRRLLDPTGEAVRELGRRLSTAGAIVERRRSEAGPAWVLRCAVVLPLLPPPPDPETAEEARQRWRRVTEKPSAGGQPF